MYNILASYGQDRLSERTLRRPAGPYNHVVAPPRTRYGHMSQTINDVVPFPIVRTVLDQYDFTDNVLCILDLS